MFRGLSHRIETLSGMSEIRRLGTRKSPLAIWQATYIQGLLKQKGFLTEIVFIQSDGESDLITPLYEFGIQGIFTKALDSALLNNQIDIAVHSLKDVPTQLPQGLMLASTPHRGSPHDVLVYKNPSRVPEQCIDYTIATSSLRRKAQWLNRYPTHHTEILRGNINTRLDKLLSNSTWDGALFAAAGIDRINLETPHQLVLDWMLPAPAQGALAVVCREEDSEILDMCQMINHEDTMLTTSTERMFLKTLMGGCSVPIAAYAVIQDDHLHFQGNVLSLDGKLKAEVQLDVLKSQAQGAGIEAAEKLMANGGYEIMNSFK